MSRGRYIVLEGGDRVGKTTQAQILVEALDRRRIPVQYIREPGGTDEGEFMRDLVKDSRIDLSPTQQALLHNGARIIMLATVVKPLLDLGSWVISDRSYLSTLVYQGHTQGEDMEWLRKITNRARQVVEPDLIVVLDGLPDRMRLRRDDSETHDRYDKMELVFHHRVRVGYINESNNGVLHPIINADDDIDEVARQIEMELAKRFEEVR